MWLKPSSPRLAVDASASLRHPLREPPTGRNHLHKPHLLRLLLFTPSPSAQGRQGDSSCGDVPWMPWLAGISSARPPVGVTVSPLRTTGTTGLIGFIPSPGSTGSHLPNPVTLSATKSTSFRDRLGNDRPQTTTASLWNAPRKLFLPAMGDVPFVFCPLPACPLSLACAPATTPRRYHRSGRRMPLGNMTMAGCFASATPRCRRPRRCGCHAPPPKICAR